MQRFGELEYIRPDIKAFKRRAQILIDELERAGSYGEAKSVWRELEDMNAHYKTMHTIATIRNNINTADTFYDGEMTWLQKASPKLVDIFKRQLEALTSSPFRPDFDAEFGPQLMRKAEAELKTRDKKIAPLLVKEGLLTQSYQKLVASCKTNFMGRECNFYGLLKYMEDPDREVRRSAYLAWADMYEQAAPKLDEIFDKLIEIRVKMAYRLGFDSYINMAYTQLGRFDYGPREVERFRAQILSEIVPLCARLRQNQAARIGADPLKYYDESFVYPGGNPVPIGTKDALLEKAGRMYRELDRESGEFFDFMLKNDLFDLETRPGKHLGGYCTSLDDYKAPFIFSNFNGTSADVDVLTHEAGHAFQYFLSSRAQPLRAYYEATYEISEVHSTSMEHFAYPWMKRFFGADADRYRQAHLTAALNFLPYAACVDEFQHRLYATPRISASGRYSLWREIEKKYLPWRDYDGVDFLEKGGSWMQKQHIFLYPFYYIDYALAQIGVFELYGRMRKDRRAAWEDYIKLCRAGGSRSYLELLNLAGLSSPFEEGAVSRALKAVAAALESGVY